MALAGNLKEISTIILKKIHVQYGPYIMGLVGSLKKFLTRNKKKSKENIALAWKRQRNL